MGCSRFGMAGENREMICKIAYFVKHACICPWTNVWFVLRGKSEQDTCQPADSAERGEEFEGAGIGGYMIATHEIESAYFIGGGDEKAAQTDPGGQCRQQQRFLPAAAEKTDERRQDIEQDRDQRSDGRRKGTIEGGTAGLRQQARPQLGGNQRGEHQQCFDDDEGNGDGIPVGGNFFP